MNLSLLLLGLILRLDCGAGKLEKLPLTSCQQRVQFVASAVTNPDSVKWRNATTTTGLATIDFDFLPAKHANITGNLTKPKKFTSRDAARLLQHRRIILVGNSMLHRLAEASIFLLGCCGEDIPRSLANSHPNSVEKAGQMIWHNGMSKNAYHGAGVYNDRELGPAFRGRARWRVPVAPHTCPKYHSIAGIPTPRQKSVGRGPMPFSVDCDLSNGRIAAGDNNATFLAFAYTNTPQLKAELQFLRALAAPPKDGYRFRSAQDDTDVVVMQVPSIDQVHEHTVELPLLEEVLASVNAVHAYDRKRRHRRRKRFLFYGRIPTTGYERGPPAWVDDWEREAEHRVLRSGHYYLPLFRILAHAVSHWGVRRETTWHFDDAGQHFITQAFFNTLDEMFCCAKDHIDAGGVELAS